MILCCLNRDRDDDQGSFSSNVTSTRFVRGTTKLRSLSLKCASGERIPLTIDVNNGVAFGPNAQMFNSYRRVITREEASILVPSCDCVYKID